MQQVNECSLQFSRLLEIVNGSESINIKKRLNPKRDLKKEFFNIIRSKKNSKIFTHTLRSQEVYINALINVKKYTGEAVIDSVGLGVGLFCLRSNVSKFWLSKSVLYFSIIVLHQTSKISE